MAAPSIGGQSPMAIVWTALAVVVGLWLARDYLK